MAAPEEVARLYQRRQKGIVLAVLAAILGLWRRLDQDRLTESWQAGIGPSIVSTMINAQIQAASAAPAYLRELAQAQNIVMPDLEVAPARLSGVSSTGAPLETALYQPIIAFKKLLAEGMPPDEAMRRATAGMAMLVATQAADAGRAAVEVGMTANKQWVSYVRVVDLPACSRCIILAGRVYSHSTGFQRHPNCDCSMMPVTGDNVEVASPRELFEQMSREEQDRRFTKAGAEAIRLGADMNQVVAARRGMKSVADQLITTEGTTLRGVAGRRLQGRTRLMPEQIIKDAGGDRDAAIEALRTNGYLVDRRVPQRRVAESATVPSSPPVISQPSQPTEPAVPVSAYHRTLDGIEDLARRVEDSQPAEVRPLGGGEVADVELLTWADGDKLVRKTVRETSGGTQEAESEQLASLMGRALGLAAPRVYRRGDAIYMEYVNGRTAQEIMGWGGDLTPELRAAIDSDDGLVMGLFDKMAFNWDRNNGNWILSEDGRPVPIDHGVAWQEMPDESIDDLIGYVRSAFADRLDGDTNAFTAADIAEVRARLEALRPDFEHAGRTGWLDYAMRVLDWVGERASGGRNIIAGIR